jgi:hypothetical protein
LEDENCTQLNLLHEGTINVPLFPGFYYAFLPSVNINKRTWEFYWGFPEQLKKECYWTEIEKWEERQVCGNIHFYIYFISYTARRRPQTLVKMIKIMRT